MWLFQDLRAPSIRPAHPQGKYTHTSPYTHTCTQTQKFTPARQGSMYPFRHTDIHTYTRAHASIHMKFKREVQEFNVKNKIQNFLMKFKNVIPPSHHPPSTLVPPSVSMHFAVFSINFCWNQKNSNTHVLKLHFHNSRMCIGIGPEVLVGFPI